MADDKLSRTERWSIKYIIRKHRKNLEKIRKERNNKEEIELKGVAAQSMLSIQEIMVINKENGEEYQIADYMTMDLDKLIDFYEESIKEMGKIV